MEPVASSSAFPYEDHPPLVIKSFLTKNCQARNEKAECPKTVTQKCFCERRNILQMATAVVSPLTKPPRRSVRSLSVQEKVQAIDRVHEGESKASVARDIGVPESTLRGWCKGEEKLRGIVARSSGGNPSASDTSPQSVDGGFEKSPKFGISESQSNPVASQKRDYFSLDDTLLQSPVVKKFPKLDKANDVPINTDIKVNQRKLESPINFSKNNENELASRNSYSPTTSMAFAKKDESRDVHNASSNPSLPALAAIASAISNKNQMLYSAYANGLLKDMVPKQETPNKPLDFSTKMPPKLPRPDVNEALMFWLQAQREQVALSMSPVEARTADSSSWFWKLYKNYGMLPQTIQSNQKSSSTNGYQTQVSDEEDEPPATAADAVRHGEKFLRWLECCSDPSVTAVQILQFRYLLNNVKECAERRRQVRTKTRSRRK